MSEKLVLDTLKASGSATDINYSEPMAGCHMDIGNGTDIIRTLFIGLLLVIISLSG